MEKLKRKKYIGTMLIVLLVVAVVGLASITKTDKFSGLVNVKNADVTSKLLSSTGALLEDSNVK